MSLGDFYTDFLKNFEPLFKDSIENIASDTKSIDPDANSTFFKPLKTYISGGKRVRPYLITVGADTQSNEALHAGVAFEICHNFVLIHDDIMDGATKRRETDTVHIAFQKYTPHGNWGAMLLGDYLSTYANEYMKKHAPQLQDIFFEMQKFLFVGQYYEMLNWGKPTDRQTSEKIEYFKSAQYTFEYPLHMGLLLAGKDPTILDEFAKNAGLAFQVRDDYLDISDNKSGKDKGLDSQNGVPNTVQLLLEKNENNLEKTRTEIQEILSNYERNALEELDQADISSRQKDALTKILKFCVTI